MLSGAYVGVNIGGLCTGTLIAPTVVLTAGHCVEHLLDQNTSILIHFGSRPGEWLTSIPSSGIAVHRLFQPNHFLHYDVALVRLSSPAPDTIAPIPFNQDALDETFAGAEVEIIGFGITNDGGAAGIKRYIRVPVEQVTYEHVVYGNQEFGTPSSCDSCHEHLNVHFHSVVPQCTPS